MPWLKAYPGGTLVYALNIPWNLKLTESRTPCPDITKCRDSIRMAGDDPEHRQFILAEVPCANLRLAEKIDLGK